MRFPLAVAVVLGFFLSVQVNAGVQYGDPDDGWAYIYTGEDAEPGAADSGFTSLDGTWQHDNGSDQFDPAGAFITDGLGAPGGILPIEDDGVDFLRLEDPGDPRGDGFSEPSHRKLFFIHDIGAEGAEDDIMDTGVTLSFRARIPTDGPLDSPASAGNGYVLHDGGKSSFTISQAGADGTAATISFALAAETEDQTDFTGGGLAMNSTAGAAVSGNVDWQGSEGEPNLFAVEDPTEWNEFWINIFKDDATGEGTHFAVVYANGEVVDEEIFNVTAGPGRDWDGNYIALGLGSTPQSGALDVDFFGWAPGIIAPVPGGGNGLACDFDDNGACDIDDIDALLFDGIPDNDLTYDMDESGTVDLDDRDAWLREADSLPGDATLDGQVIADDLNQVGINWQTASATSWSQGDFDGNGEVNALDLNQVGIFWQKNSAEFAGAAPSSVVPEPSGATLSLVLAFSFLAIRQRR